MARKRTGRNGKGVTLYLNTEIYNTGRELARARYDVSFSDLIERLIKAEAKLKRGKLHKAA